MNNFDTINDINQILTRLESLGSEKVRKQNTKQGATSKQFGVKLGDIRKLAKVIKLNHELGLQLWDTENIDARHLAILLLDPKQLSKAELDRLVETTNFSRVADWLNSYIVKKHPNKEELRALWMQTTNPMRARAGWNLTTERVAKKPEGLDLPALLTRLDKEMSSADPLVQWTMNFCLVEIGIKFPEYRKQATEIGEKLGIYRDFPVSKGCTSPYAPIWIKEMVDRQK